MRSSTREFYLYLFSFATNPCFRAHRAANPSKFPISAETRRLYPRMAEIEAKYPTQTKVHLQVYDGCAHVLPILFAFTTPAKYCFRAIASFCRFATGMQSLSPRPSSPTTANGAASPLQRSFFGGSLFTSPPEEVGDLLTESRRRSWWGGEKDSSMARTSKTGKADKEKQRSDKEKSKDKATKENSKGGSQGQRDKVERVKVEAKGEGSKEEVQKGSTDHPEPRKVENDDTKVEAVGKVGVVSNGSPPVGEDKAGEVRTVDQQLKAETVGKTEDNIATSPRNANSFHSSNSSKSNQSRGSTKPGKRRWSLMIPRSSTPEQIPVPSKELTEDVAGSRFEGVKEQEGERCAGDYPPTYVNGFVSPIPFPRSYLL